MGHEYTDCFGRISASQVFSCSKYRLPTIKNQLQAVPKVAVGGARLAVATEKTHSYENAQKTRGSAQRVGGYPSRVGLCWAGTSFSQRSLNHQVHSEFVPPPWPNPAQI
jgi:hypothetical protein